MRRMAVLVVMGLVLAASEPAKAQKVPKLPRVGYLALTVNVSVPE